MFEDWSSMKIESLVNVKQLTIQNISVSFYYIRYFVHLISRDMAFVEKARDDL